MLAVSSTALKASLPSTVLHMWVVLMQISLQDPLHQSSWWYTHQPHQWSWQSSPTMILFFSSSVISFQILLFFWLSLVGHCHGTQPPNGQYCHMPCTLHPWQYSWHTLKHCPMYNFHTVHWWCHFSVVSAWGCPGAVYHIILHPQRLYSSWWNKINSLEVLI